MNKSDYDRLIAENSLEPQGGETILAKYGGIVRKLGMWVGNVIEKIARKIGGIER